MEERKGKRKTTGSSSEDFITHPSHVHRPKTGLHERESLGDRIRKAREAHNITINELSVRTGTDIETLKSIEANKMTPPLGELVKLGKALATRMSYFISPGVDKPVTVVRADQRRPVSRNIKTGSEQYGYFYESLAPEKANRRMEPFIVTLVPCDAAETSTHDGQEFLIVLEGQMIAKIGDRTESLGPGDAIYYDSSEPHYVRCAGEGKAKILAVIYPGSE
jgi:mannose-6-phosphate isomerase-like protein (cupin superfamily)